MTERQSETIRGGISTIRHSSSIIRHPSSIIRNPSRTWQTCRVVIQSSLFLLGIVALFLYSLYTTNNHPETVSMTSASIIHHPSSIIHHPSSTERQLLRVHHHGITILGTDCSSNFDSSPFGIICYVLICLYLFLGLAIICDDYFVASLELIVERLELPPSVAGATFMAAGSSAPELFTSVVGVFISETDVGIGTIIGSAAFNICVIIGVTALLSRATVLTLDRKVLYRDCACYSIAVLLLVITLLDSVVEWYEAIVLISSYFIYIALMMHNDRLMLWVFGEIGMVYDSSSIDKRLSEYRGVTGSDVDDEHSSFTHHPSSTLDDDFDDDDTEYIAATPSQIPPILSSSIDHPSSTNHPVFKHTDQLQPTPTYEYPTSFIGKFFFVISVPYQLLFYITIPDCRKEKLKKYYFITCLVSVIWIGILSFITVEAARKIGCVAGLNEGIMGLTIVAVGASVPDMLSSVMVARDGQGDMAVSNAFGSNVFDILLGLGLPWVIKTCFLQQGSFVPVSTNGMLSFTILLFLVLTSTMLMMKISGWKLRKWMGWVLLGKYCVFVMFALHESLVTEVMMDTWLRD